MSAAGPREPAPPAATVAVLGYGRFGQAFAGLLQQAGHRVRAWDPRAQIPAALAATSMPTAIDGAAWIVLAMPVPQLRESLIALRPLLHAGQTVLDVGSVKMHPCATMDELLGAAIPHVGTHPLFGPLSLARDERPRRTVICPAADHPEVAERARELFAGLGCEVIEQNPEAHDRAMAMTHALAFFVAKGLLDIGVNDGLPLAPPSFQGMQHMLAAVRGDAGHLFAAIQRENPFAAEARARLLAELERVHRQLLADADGDSLAIPAPPA
ncbi:prephenate dehydrogenase/arogenate dehydrogenase family protein [Rhodanobacter denitrificans]|uniref:Prephenate dehydrogenase n=1 Tax=Rhodanobacter denitrificans TaxID=666685 RepID=M4NQV3_9GAMM|nr:prephenate dehydrogenase/arogenate dehydrogenase family protein [Rhodanobacter denitrificans]AGG89961.1 prephenate dehydrogenase [Rhodanobacter denitrificans]UJJ57730.1 prephenate dehydrogenase/arogenate dehydrogenase family protein [Rhodanobacter denitrificans]UJM85357.1 prephenate dehydrogenase/arogenate dehydrogenase family protein [Rhodanobacter denitrificans]UJM91603.1 prephenate dehydrogenase/arogenate dehydrogenase family protein [Rhodanobacter denitrificans]